MDYLHTAFDVSIDLIKAFGPYKWIMASQRLSNLVWFTGLLTTSYYSFYFMRSTLRYLWQNTKGFFNPKKYLADKNEKVGT
jgi:hypothetical protein